VLLVVGTVLCAVAVDAVKPYAARKRPTETVPWGGSWQTGAGRNSSFPSGHVATAFAFGRGLSLACPPLTPVVLAAGAGTAVSRMYDGRHYLSDCLVGAAWGWFAVGGLWKLAEGFGFRDGASSQSSRRTGKSTPSAERATRRAA
ncbi:MAG: phosphatase PAP2 family protein, partial [Planctomycetia bacterium]